MRMILCEIDFKENTNCKSYHNIFQMILVTCLKKHDSEFHVERTYRICKTKAAYLKWKMGTLRSEDSGGGGGGGEKVTLKVNWRSFGVHRDYSNSLTFSNVGDFSWSWILEIVQVQKDWKDNEKFVLFTSPTKREIRKFRVVIACSDSKEMYKQSVSHVQSCFCAYYLYLLLFWRPRCPRRRRILGSLMTLSRNEKKKKKRKERK